MKTFMDKREFYEMEINKNVPGTYIKNLIISTQVASSY